MIVSCIPDIDIELMLLEYTSNWPKMCGTKCHTGQKCHTTFVVEATSWTPWGPPIESHVLWILYLLSPVILLHIIIVYVY